MSPARNYRQKSTGKKVKGVTTHLSILNKPALVWWGYQQGMDNFNRLMAELAIYANNGEALQPKVIGMLIQDFKATGLYDKRDTAADAGTLAHLFVENHLKGLPEPSTEGKSKEVIEKAEGCYLTWLDFEKSNQISVFASEVELTSENNPYGGTIDHIVTTAMTPKGSFDILDIKTGKDIYLEAKIQVRAYKPLWEEHHPEMPISGFHIVRLGQTGEFTHKYFPSLDDGYFKVFMDCLDITETLVKLGEKL